VNHEFYYDTCARELTKVDQPRHGALRCQYMDSTFGAPTLREPQYRCLSRDASWGCSRRELIHQPATSPERTLHRSQSPKLEPRQKTPKGQLSSLPIPGRRDQGYGDVVPTIPVRIA
jgi:hypothetical protein